MRWLDFAGAVVLGVWGGMAVSSSTPLAWLVALQCAVAGVLILAHPRPRREAPAWVRMAAWGAVLLPFGLRAPHAPWWSLVLSGTGVAVSLWAMISLGTAFGIAPADRGLVTGGPYRWVRHPMYTGEALSWLAVVLSNPCGRNLALGGVLLAVLGLRVWWEERVIMGYDAYRVQTPWRFVPGVW